MLFFRYQGSGTLHFAMLRRGEIFFASPSELNDAHEFRPQLILNGKTELWQRLAHYILLDLVVVARSHGDFEGEMGKKIMALANQVGTLIKRKVRSKDLEMHELCPVFVEAISPLLSEILPKSQAAYIGKWLKEYILKTLPKSIEDHHYVSCFSLNATNPTMWGHYSNAEKGFVIIYKTENNTLHVHSPLKILQGTRPSKDMEGVIEVGSYGDEHLELKPVTYRRNLPRVNAFYELIYIFPYSEEEYHYDVPENLPSDVSEKEEKSLGLIKFSDWRYEKEIRVFLPFVAHRYQGKRDKLTPDARVLRASGENIAGLIFGPKMSSEDKERAITCCYMMRKCQTGETNGDFAFFQAEQQNNRFDLLIKPVGILDESFYHHGFSQMKPLKELPAEKVQQLNESAKAIMDSAQKGGKVG